MSEFDQLEDLIFSEKFVRELSVEDEAWMRRAVFVRPETQEDLHAWIELYLGLDFPDAIVDPKSNSSPMKMIFETYNAARLNDNPDFHRILFFASRDSFKTLGSAVLEVLMIVLLKRDVAHIAAILDQSRKAKQYARLFFGKPILKDYVTGMSERHTEFTHPDGTKNTMQILVMTLQGTNFEHTSYVCLDELDVIRNPEAYKELAFVASPRDGFLPITLLTSSRKWSFGPVQREIDDAEKTGLLVRHWNILDVTQKCSDARCLPMLPKIPIYRSDITLKAISEADFAVLNPEDQKLYIRDEGFAGCLQNCKLFSACRTRLYHSQTSKSPLLKPIAHVQNLLRSASIEKVKAQLLCWKPSAEGLVYTTLDRDAHFKTPGQIAEMIDGNPRPLTFSKLDLIFFVAKMVRDGALSLHAGVDWGFTHNYVFTLGVLDGQRRTFILECFSMAGLELDQSIQLTGTLLVPYGGIPVPLLYPDNSYPAYIKTYRRKGFRCKDFKKDVQGGIEAVRYGLMDSSGASRMFFLAGDEGVQLLWTRMNQYHWMLDAAGRPTDQPDEENDDECFTGDTEVLTGDGWKSLADVTENDDVAAVTDNGHLSMEKPIRVIHKSYTGKMVSIKHPHVEFCATEDHQHAVITQTDWKIKGEFKLIKRSISEVATESYWPTNASNWPEGPGLFGGNEDEAWFAGFWLAEGCFDNGRPTFLIVDQTKLPIVEKIRSVLARLGWTYSETKDPRCNSIRFVASGQLERAKLWRQLFGAGSANKHLDISTVLSMTRAERAALWEGYMCGDGSRTQSTWHFDSISSKLADGIQILTLSLNYGCRLVSYPCMAAGRLMTNPDGRTYKTSQSYRGHVLQKRSGSHLKRDRFIYSDASSIMVHCVNTSTGFFLARTNGKVFVAGNCDSIRYLCQNIYTQSKGVIISTQQTPQDIARGSIPVSTGSYDNYLSKIIQDELAKKGGNAGTPKGQRGSLVWDIGDDSEDVIQPIDIINIFNKDPK